MKMADEPISRNLRAISFGNKIGFRVTVMAHLLVHSLLVGEFIFA